MRLVAIESPYRGATLEECERNVRYARRALADCLARGEAPWASHLLYTQVGSPNDQDLEERKRGIEAGYAWSDLADALVFYTDLGWSPGMLAARARAENRGQDWECRTLSKDVFDP